ncbi:DNA translocase FtsK [Candidatus Shapirobacteria bacterium CG03_land_8_20_14_0_80_35_14]|uniref:DNA translocase FtsK n=1 Tax=Candidatus Shapirobacteria bacterium CG03_land_8_20_14_0_80_35_14 TaxID=1974878 RepID=A0A2M7BQC9_9BACT|nr:MAG: DNA translocase FtsK [Candidatus Shapirobacteria bacterium CG03_land_8_20_14_0_80_35_14]
MPRGRKKSKILPSLKLKPDTVRSIFFIFFLILSVISVISFLQQGSFATQFNQLMQNYFGFASVMIPFLLLLISFLFAKIKSFLREANVFFGFLIMFISSLALFKQGLVGIFLWQQSIAILSEIIAFIVFFFAFIVGIVVLFDTNIVQIVKFISRIFLIIKKYTVGLSVKSKEKKSAKIENKPIFAKDEPHFSKKDEQKFLDIPPVLKSDNNSIFASPILSSSNNQVWNYPPISIFDNTPGTKADRGNVSKNANIIEQTLESFGITARVADVNESPSVTQYAIEVALGTKLTKVVSLSNDLAMALSAPGGQIRIEAPIPGRSLVGIEVPNRSLEVVPIRQILESDAMKNARTKICVPLGLDVAGIPKVADIDKMPHVLIAGQTGSGKSVCINSWISTLLFRASPDELRLIMVDPKRVELTPYNGIPHLLTPVIVEPEKVVSALKWAVSEMENRYKIFTQVGAKNIDGYNNISGIQSLPYIIIFIDELADIMLFSPAEVEDNICRIAQMARAVGIHLVLATQRPSVNIITGLIKANIPTRLAFAVASMMDSRVILDSPGAEKLLGRGDMLYIPPEQAKPSRVQGCFISDKEIGRLVEFLKKQRVGDYNDEILKQPVKSHGSLSPNLNVIDGKNHDSLFTQAVELTRNSGKASASFFQRHLRIGYARAASILDEMEHAGIIGPVKGAKAREILILHATPSDDQ